MIHNTGGNSIIEVMVVMIILTIGIVGTYGIIDSGQQLSTTSENRIKAINIAREGLESVENIRDTNWLKFSSDYGNCWKVKDYNPLCIGDTSGNKYFSTGSYVLVQSGVLWMLSGTISPLSIQSSYSGYLDQFPIYLDNNGLTTHVKSLIKCIPSITNNCKTIFTREIQISNPDQDHMGVTSITTWKDPSRNTPYEIRLQTTLTNWKKKF